MTSGFCEREARAQPARRSALSSSRSGLRSFAPAIICTLANCWGAACRHRPPLPVPYPWSFLPRHLSFAIRSFVLYNPSLSLSLPIHRRFVDMCSPSSRPPHPQNPTAHTSHLYICFTAVLYPFPSRPSPPL